MPQPAAARTLPTAYAIERRLSTGATPTERRCTGQLQDSYIKLIQMGARWFDPYINRWIQPDSIVPEAGNPQALNRYSFVANNPLKYIDPSGHCWGIASGIRGLPGYSTTCNNMDMALTIVQSPEAAASDKFWAGAYLGAEGAAHLALAIGAAGLACATAGPACVKAVEAALGIGAGACADGDCGNEATAAAQGAQGISQALQNSAPTAQSVADKLQRYLLNPTHPEGGSKAAWFEQALGFTRGNAADLAKQVIFNPSTARQSEVTQFGVKFEQIITVTGANGKQIDVLFVWIQRHGEDFMRLVTGIPTGK